MLPLPAPDRMDLDAYGVSPTAQAAQERPCPTGPSPSVRPRPPPQNGET